MAGLSAPAIPSNTNLTIAFSLFLFHLLMLVVLPLWLLPQSQWWALLIPLFIWVQNTHWALIHEAVHRLLSPQSQANETIGRALGIMMGASFDVLRFGHFMHHQYNRAWESEIHRGTEAMWKVRAKYYAKLLGGLYFTEVAITLAVTLLPNAVVARLLQGSLKRIFEPAASAAEQVFFRRGKIKNVRLDGMAVIMIYGSAVYFYSGYWIYLVLFLYTRALAISFFDNIYHYATAHDNSEAAKELAMPRILSLVMLHNNYHETHHTQPSIPWNALPKHQRKPFGASIIDGARAQFAGPILAANP